jgi:hypothetical protein
VLVVLAPPATFTARRGDRGDGGRRTHTLDLELHFGLHPRVGFAGHRYSVTVPAGSFRVRPTDMPTGSGYQFNGELELLKSRIVIDDPLTRAKPHRRADYRLER